MNAKMGKTWRADTTWRSFLLLSFTACFYQSRHRIRQCLRFRNDGVYSAAFHGVSANHRDVSRLGRNHGGLQCFMDSDADTVFHGAHAHLFQRIRVDLRGRLFTASSNS